MKKLSTRNTLLYIIGSIVCLVVAFTPFYTLSYVLLVLYAAKALRLSDTYATVIGRIVVSLLLLALSIACVCLVLWTIHLPQHPAIIGIAFIGLVSLLKKWNRPTLKHPAIDTGDVFGAVMALSVPLVVLASFYLPTLSPAAEKPHPARTRANR